MKISKDEFTRYISLVRIAYIEEQKIRKMGIDMGQLAAHLESITKSLEHSIFNQYQLEMIEWWLYDTPKGIEKNSERTDLIRDRDKNPIMVRTPQELYDYLMTLTNEALAL